MSVEYQKFCTQEQIKADIEKAQKTIKWDARIGNSSASIAILITLGTCLNPLFLVPATMATAVFYIAYRQEKVNKIKLDCLTKPENKTPTKTEK